MIVATAEKILHAAVDGLVNWADSDDALRAAYPDWFDEPGCTRDTYYQRLSRARARCVSCSGPSSAGMS